jgi:hypothetical protein
MVDELLRRYQGMPDEAREQLDKFIDSESAGHLWIPSPGPQLEAVQSEADTLLYGGAGGAGKSDLLLGLAFEHHQRTLLVRKHYTDLTALTDRAKEINDTEKGFKGSIPPRLRTVNKKLIDFGGLAEPGSEEHWQGQAHDLLGIDEVVQLPEVQVRYLMGWVRSADPKQRCRTILATNPPTSSTGDWIIPMFGPWLDTRHPMYPTPPGVLRWCVTDEDGHDFWVDGPEPVEIGGRMRRPLSRTFIPGRMVDNPFLRDTNYAAVLDGLKEPLRSALRDGNFMAARVDDPMQVIPTDWVRAAQNRWTREIPYNVPQCAIGVDAARIRDQTVLAPRYGGYYPQLIKCKGEDTPHGRDVAALVLKHRKHDSIVIFDCGETNGAQAFAHCEENGMQVRAHIGMDKSVSRTEEKKLKFFNKRAEVYWRFREALDPLQDGGSEIILPDDPLLVADLTAPHFELTAQGIKITPKKEVVKMLGRSPDSGDAVVLAWVDGPKSFTHATEWNFRADQRVGTLAERSRRPAVNKGPRHHAGPRRH